jgi:hypothetical protein
MKWHDFEPHGGTRWVQFQFQFLQHLKNCGLFLEVNPCRLLWTTQVLNI